MIVADTNLLAYLLIGGPYTEAAQQVLARDKDWVAPPFWKHEFLNVVATCVRTKQLDEQRAFIVLGEASAYVRSHDHSDSWSALQLSVRKKIATYDCEFIVLAQRLQTRLVTADKPILKNFPDIAVSIEDFAAGK